MKKSRILLALAGLALIFAGCSDVGSVSGVSAANASQAKTAGTSGLRTITLNATSDQKLITFPAAQGGARTILPPTVNGADVKFRLFYTDMYGSDSEKKYDEALTFTAANGSTTKGTINISLPVSYYKFTLYCLPSSAVEPDDSKDADGTAMFKSYAFVDLARQNEVTFYLTPDGLKGTGEVNLKLYTSNTNSTTDLWKVPAGYKVTAEIRSKTGAGEKLGTSYTPTDGVILDLTAPGSEATAIFVEDPSEENFSVEGIPSGSYNFVVTFTKGDHTFYFTDEIVILPNQTTNGNEVFIPDVIEKEPAPPTNFFVAYADPLNEYDDYYYAQFAWSDNSNNESHFEIDLVDVSDYASNMDGASPAYKITAAPTNDDGWASAMEAYGKNDKDIETYAPYKYDITSDSPTRKTIPYNEMRNPNQGVYSLTMNNKTAVFMLELGKRYLARIRAVNDMNKNKKLDERTKEYAYVVIDDDSFGVDSNKITYGTSSITIGETIDNLAGRITGSVNVFASDVNTINRFKIKYNLTGGEFKKDDVPGPGLTALVGNEKPKELLYMSQKGSAKPLTGVEILNPDGFGTSYNADEEEFSNKNKAIYLIANERTFLRWHLESSNSKNKYPATEQWSENGSTWYDDKTDSTTYKRYVPGAYTGHENLELFANYNADLDAEVIIPDYEAFEWKDGEDGEDEEAGDVAITYNVLVTGDSEGAPSTVKPTTVSLAKNQHIDINKLLNSSITITLNDTMKNYNSVTLRAWKTTVGPNNPSYLKTVDLSGDEYGETAGTNGKGKWTSGFPKEIEIPIQDLDGTCQLRLEGKTSKIPNEVFTFPIVIQCSN